MSDSLIQILGIVDCALLRRISSNQFEVIGKSPAWLADLLPQAHASDHFSLGDSSAFLQDFLVDAEQHWKQRSAELIESGIWTEETAQRTLRLEAAAAIDKQDCYLVIYNREAEFKRQQKTLQVARELLLSNDRITAQHEYLHDRLEDLLTQTHTLQSLQAPIQQALENTDEGIFIVDKRWSVVQQNPAASEIFMAEDAHSHYAFDELTRILREQLPEWQGILQRQEAWSGEIFWHKPPQTNKWLQISLYPVLSETNLIRHWLVLVTDISQLKHLQQSNEKLSLYDRTTHLPNRQYFWQSLEQKVYTGRPFFLFYMDIKQFKHINQLHGHQVGDALLLEFASRISAAVDDSVTLSRLGGDEFALLLPDVDDPTYCHKVAKQIFTALSAPFYLDRDISFQAEVSIGSAHFPSDASDPEDLMRYADLAMHEARLQQKSNIQFYSQDLVEASQRRHQLEVELRQAVENEEFELFLQPVFDLASAKILKAEALIRWRKPDGNLVGPDKFISIAEHTGLINPIGKWVIARACVLIQRLQKCKPGIKVAINLSPRQISDRHLFEYIESMIKRSKIDPSLLELELTEGVLVDNFERVNLMLQKARKAGIHVSIDDFGTGYSSLRYLQKLPIDHLKIDRSFVQELESNTGDKAIVTAIIALAHNLELGVIAEGVETLAQKTFLHQHNCDGVQGFLFSKPVSVDAFCQQLLSEAN